jgi:hypothetical protein
MAEMQHSSTDAGGTVVTESRPLEADLWLLQQPWLQRYLLVCDFFKVSMECSKKPGCYDNSSASLQLKSCLVDSSLLDLTQGKDLTVANHMVKSTNRRVNILAYFEK